MAHFGTRLRELRTQRQILQSAFAEQCDISPAYLSDIERGRRNPPADKAILRWARHLDPGGHQEIGDELISLAARDRSRAEAVTVSVTEEAPTVFESTSPSTQKPHNSDGGASATPFLDHFQIDLVGQARGGRLDPAPGREREFVDIAGVVSCRSQNSAVLTKSSSAEAHRVVRGLACAIAERTAPEPLLQIRILGINAVQAGVKYRGQLEERLSALTREAATQSDLLLYFPALGDLADLEKSVNGSYFVPALMDGAVRVLTSAHPAELDYCRHLNPGLVDCFRQVTVRPLDRDRVLRSLSDLRERYAAHHGVSYSEEALVAIVDAAEEGDECGFWTRALGLLDEVGARKRLAGASGDVAVADVDAIANLAR